MNIRKDVLVVEDKKDILELLSNSLSSAYNVHKAARIYEARQLLRRKHIDLITLDLVLPDGDGLVFCEEIKLNYPDTKVIVLTNKNDGGTRLKTFKLGAEDYLQKPFYPEEMLARISRLLKTNEEELTFKHSKIILNQRDRSIRYDNATILLTRKETLLMEYLLKDPYVKATEKILEYMRSKTGDRMSRKALVVFISRLRKKFERNIGMEIIKTRYGQGYYLGL